MCFPPQSRTLVRSVYVNYENVEEVASYMHESVTVDKDNRVIHVSSGSSNQRLIDVPIGCIPSDANVVITLGLPPAHYNTNHDRDPKVGISDGEGNRLLYKLHDVNNYPKWTPCRVEGGDYDNVLVSEGTPFPGKFELTINPKNKYAVCETAQDGGYITTGQFNKDLDHTGSLNLQVRRDDSHEEYLFHYFKVDIYRY